MTQEEMLKIATDFQSDMSASFIRLGVEDDTDMMLMMLAGMAGYVIERSGDSWKRHSLRGLEFWKIVEDAYGMIKVMRSQSTRTVQ